MEVSSRNKEETIEIKLIKEAYERYYKISLCLYIEINSVHQNNIIHRDIKPQNILFDEESNLKLTDFGISLLSSETKIAQITGTQFFLAPESFLPEKEKVINGKPLDIWAIGITMYCFKFLELPFSGKNYDDTIKQIQSKKYNRY